MVTAGRVIVRVEPIGSPPIALRDSVSAMLARWGIRIASSLIGIAVGIVLSTAIFDGFSSSTTGLVEATIVFWIVFLIVNFLALRVLIRQPSVGLAGLLALGSTIVSLIIVNLIVSDISIRGVSAYLGATVVIWISTVDRRLDRPPHDPRPPPPVGLGETQAPGCSRARTASLIDRSVNGYPPRMARELREVVFVDGVRTAFGRAGESGLFWKTRADDMAVKVVRELLRRNPSVPAERIGDVDPRRDGAGRRPGPDARPRRRAARRAAAHRARASPSTACAPAR